MAGEEENITSEGEGEFVNPFKEGGSKSHEMNLADPLYIHPSDLNTILKVDSKLKGMSNYFEWKRDMEISLLTRRKMGLLTGLVKRSKTDPIKAAAWDACNGLLVGWILHNMEGDIKRSVMYFSTAKEIWDYLARTFAVGNGARKYQVDLELRELSQGNKSVSEYHTQLRILWQTLENLEEWPPLTEWSTEINAYMDALSQKEEEKKLFKLLNGLNSCYGGIRSNLLMRSPLPRVEEAVAILQQEETQIKVLSGTTKIELDSAALFTKKNEPPGCLRCKKKGHTIDSCWWVVGFPSDQKGRGQYNSSAQGQHNKWHDKGKRPAWNKNYKESATVNYSSGSSKNDAGNTGGNITLSTDQLYQLINSRGNSKSTGYDAGSEEEMVANFAGLFKPED